MNSLDYILDKFNLSFNDKTLMPIEIPNFGREQLTILFRELEYKTGAEIGVAEGNFSKLICSNNPRLKLFGIDPWLMYQGFPEGQSQDKLNQLSEEANINLKPYIETGAYKIIKKTSQDALVDIKDNSLDFVYIDANHEAPYIEQDIEGWSRKVRPGGIVSGHDYVRLKGFDYAVIRALHKYTDNHKIRPWFVLGLHTKIPGLIRDNMRSWMFVKDWR